MPNKHAMLSVSSSARWLACLPSAQLCIVLPDIVRHGRLRDVADSVLTVIDAEEHCRFCKRKVIRC